MEVKKSQTTNKNHNLFNAIQKKSQNLEDPNGIKGIRNLIKKIIEIT